MKQSLLVQFVRLGPNNMWNNFAQQSLIKVANLKLLNSSKVLASFDFARMLSVGAIHFLNMGFVLAKKSGIGGGGWVSV